MKGIDTSHYQGDKGLIDWNKVKSDNVEFAFLKTTGGTSFIDKMFKRDKEEATKVGLYKGSYHFAGKGFSDSGGGLFFVAQDPMAEADWYIKNADYKKGDLTILDWEIQYEDPVNWCNVFRNRVMQKLGTEPIVYLNESTFFRYNWPQNWKYWIAKYPKPDTGEMKTQPKGNWKIFQYSSKGTVSGIKGSVDMNYTPLTMKELMSLGNEITIPAPTPSSTIGQFINLKQGDKEWGDVTIGKTNVMLKDQGCTITCLSMLSFWYGNYKKPSWIAKNLQYTDNGKVYWATMNGKLPMKFVYRYKYRDDVKIKSTLASANDACLLEVNSGSHWVVLVGYSKLFGYKIADPFYGDTVYLNKRYKNISGFTVVTRA